MSWQHRTIAIWRQYDRVLGDYTWISDDSIAGWERILAAETEQGWELVSSCVDTYLEGNSSMEATAYRLFLRRAVGSAGQLGGDGDHVDHGAVAQDSDR